MTVDPETAAVEPRHPAYKRLAGDLRETILRGDYAGGKRLPTETELAVEHGLSRQTVRQAYAELVQENLIYRVRGRGSFATPAHRSGPYLRATGSIPDLLALSEDTQLEVVEPLVQRADLEAAGRLRLDSDSVYAAVFRRLYLEVPFVVTAVFLPPAVAQIREVRSILSERGNTTNSTVIGLLDRASVGPVFGAYQSVTAVNPSPDVGVQIECDSERPVIRIDRLYYNRDGDFIMLAVNHFNPDRYSYRVELRR